MQKQFDYKIVAIKPEGQLIIADELPQESQRTHSAAARAVFSLLAALQIAPYLAMLAVLYIACGGEPSKSGGPELVSLPYTISDFEKGTDPQWSSSGGLKLEVKTYPGSSTDNPEGGSKYLEVKANDPNAVPGTGTPDTGTVPDTGEPDAGTTDVGTTDAKIADAGTTDTDITDGGKVPDTSKHDGGAIDASTPIQYPGTLISKVGKSFISTGAYLTFDIQMEQFSQILIELIDDDNNPWKIDIDAKAFGNGGDDVLAYNYAHLQGKPGWVRVSIPFSSFLDTNSNFGDNSFNPFPASSSPGTSPDAGTDKGTKTTGSVNGDGGLLEIHFSARSFGQTFKLDNVSITPTDGTKDLSTTSTDGGADAGVVKDGEADAGTTDEGKPDAGLDGGSGG